MRKFRISFLKTAFLSCFLFIFSNFISTTSFCQSMANYAGANFTATSGTYTSLSGGTTVPSLLVDDVASSFVPIGFTFVYMGVPYTQVRAGSDGYLSFGATGSSISNNLATGIAVARPVIAPFWDDMDGRGTGAAASYLTTGVSPNRVFTFEWLNWGRTGVTTPQLSFQVKLYEADGKVEFIYRQESAALGGSPSASIGLSAITTGSGNFVSLNSAGASPTTSTTTETTTISTKPATGQIYTFTPPGPTPDDPTTLSFTAVTATTTTVNFVDNSTNETGFIVQRATDAGFTTNLVNTPVATTTSAGTGTAYTSAQTGLLPGTTYFYRILALNEGKASAGLTGSQVTSAAAVYVWNATTGTASWATPSSWTPTRTTPDNTDILQFSNGGSSTATSIPTQTISRLSVSNNTTINLQSAATATLTIASDGTSANELSVESGSTLINNSTFALTLTYSGTGSTGNIAGTMEVTSPTGTIVNAFNFSGGTTPVTTVAVGGILANGQSGGTGVPTITSTATNLIINGTYNHKFVTQIGTIPTATWNVTSNLNITGYINPTAGSFPSGSTQTFGNVTWNTPLMSTAPNLSGGTLTCNGNFSLLSTGTSELRLGSNSSGTISCAGFTQSGGIINCSAGTGLGIIRASGNFNQSSGTITESSSGNGTIEFNGTSAQTVTIDGTVSNTINFRINNNAGINLSGTMPINSGASLRISSIAATPINGGTLTYTGTTTLTYDASTGAQTVTTNEFPATGGPTNLTINNTSTSPNNVVSIPFSRTVGGTLTMTAGNIDLGANNLTLGSSGAPGSLTYTSGLINVTSGKFTRFYPTSGLPTTVALAQASPFIGYYPIGFGGVNRNVTLFFSSSTSLTAAGSITVGHTNSAGTTSITPFTDGGQSIDTRTNSNWDIAQSGNTLAGTIGVRIQGSAVGSIGTVANLRMIRDMDAVGTSANGTGTAVNPQVNRTGLDLTTLVNTFYIGGPAADLSSPPVIALSTNDVAAGNISQGTINNPIYSFAISPTVANATLTGLTVTTTGTYAAADLTNLKVYYSSSTPFVLGSSTLLSTKTTGLAPGAQIFPSFTSQVIPNGTTGYIFITADVPCSATLNNTIAVNAVTGSNTTFAVSTATGSPAAGNTQTISVGTPINVTSPAASSLSPSTAAVSWVNAGCFNEIMIVARASTANDGTPSGDGTAYTGNLAFGSGTALGSGFVVYKGTTSPQTITGLSFNTPYFFKIYTRLGTSWSSGVEVSVTPTYCTPTSAATSTATYISNVTTTGANSNINNTSTYSTGGYINNSSTIIVSQTAGSIVNYSVSIVSGTVGLGIWVDWNQNGVFTEPGENVYNSSAYINGPATGSFTVPLGAMLGTTRMRVIADYNSNTPTSCVAATSGRGEAEDYGFIITAPVTPTITLATNDIVSGNITQGTNNNPIYSFAISPTVANATLTGLTITTTGTYAAADLTNLKVYYSTATPFVLGSATLLSTKTTGLGAGSQVFPTFTTNPVITNGATGYIFITADIPCTATVSNTIAVDAVTGSNTTFALGTATGTPAAGNTQTISDGTPVNATAVAASILSVSSAVSWTNPTGCFTEIMIVARAGSANDGTPTGDGTAYTGNLAFGSGTALGSGFVVYKGATSPQVITGLTNGTPYFFKIFTRLGTTWSSGVEVSVTPTYCTSTGPATQGSDYFTSFSATVSGVGITNTASGYSTNGYGNFTAQSVTQAQGGIVDFSAVSPGIANGSTFGIFVDWNQDGDFLDATELAVSLGASPQITTNPSGTFTVPIGATLGSTRMRVIIKDASGAVVSCNNALANSETEDYTFIVTAPVTPTITLATNDIVAGNIAQGTNNNPIYSFAISSTVANATLTGLTITTTGTYAAADLTNLKAYYSASTPFVLGSATLLSTKTTGLGAGSQVFPTFTTNPVITNGSTGYIFITADIPCTATVSNTIAVDAVTGSNTTFALGTATGTPAAGNTQTISDGTPVNATAVAASILSVSSAVSWTNPTGCFNEIMIIARAGSANDGTPTGDGTAYTGNLAFGSGTALGSGFVVYKGSTSPQVITGLTNGTPYFFKIFTRLGTIWSSGVEVSATPYAYCVSSLHSSSTNNVTNVTMTGTTLNSSNGLGTNGFQLVPITPSSNTATIVKGVSYPISLTVTGSPTQVAVWVDFNANGVFASTEYFLMTITGSTATGSIVVPAGATTGIVGLRVRARGAAFTSSDACLTFPSGETEDYMITISDPPAPTITSLSSYSGCPGGNLTIDGTNLLGATAANVTVGGTPVVSITSNNGNQLVVVLGAGTNGTVSVTTPGGTATDPTPFAFNPKPSASATSNSPVCVGTTLNLDGTTNAGMGATFNWTGPNSFTSTSEDPTISGVTTAAAGTYTFTATSAAGCTSDPATTIVVVNPSPTATVITQGASVGKCASAATVELNATNGTLANNVILSENFNGSLPGWTTLNNSTGGTPANAAWLTYLSDPSFRSNDNTNFVLSDSDAQGSGGLTRTELRAPVMDLTNYTTVNLNFWHHFDEFSTANDTAFVEVSTNNTSWTELKKYFTDQGTPTVWVTDNISLNTFAGQATVYLRFRYKANYGFFWGIDNVTVSGNLTTSKTWSPTTGLFTDAGGTIAYTGTNLATVYAAPASTQAYTVTSTSGAGCTSTASVNVIIEGTVVNSSANAGPGSLRSVLTCIAENGTITYDQPTTTTTILTAPLTIDKNVTIQGLSDVARPEITTDPAAASGIIINVDKTLTLQNVDIKSTNPAQTFSGAGNVSITGLTISKP